MADDLAVFGAPSEVIQEALADDPRFDVWQENLPYLEFFCRCRTQWTVSFSGVVGLNYPAVESLMRMMKIENAPEFFAEIQAMEFAALPVLNEKAD